MKKKKNQKWKAQSEKPDVKTPNVGPTLRYPERPWKSLKV
jgi:hypothetical protein